MVIIRMLGPIAPVIAKKNLCDVAQVFAILSIVLFDPLRDRPLQRRAFMALFHLGECFSAEMRHKWLFSLSHPVVTRHINVSSQIPTCSVSAKEKTRRGGRLLFSTLRRLPNALRR